MISPDQSRAARALLGWSAQDAADAANIGIATMKRFESGQPVQPGTLTAIADGLTAAGVAFIDEGEKSWSGGAGVRLTGLPRPAANASR